MLLRRIAFGLGVLWWAQLATANFIVNGSFESGPAISGRLLTVTAPDSTTLPGWTVSNNDLEIITSVEWIAAHGSRSIDLNGVTNAAMYQDVTGLTPGLTYRLTFAMSGNPFVNGDPVGEADTVKSLRVTAGPQVQNYGFDVTPYHTPSGTTVLNMGWRYESLDFVATSSTARIQFESLDPSNSTRGPALDDVSLQVIPEPVVGCCVFPLAMALRRNRRRSR